jgi:hypothetical protein
MANVAAAEKSQPAGNMKISEMAGVAWRIETGVKMAKMASAVES